MADAAHAWAVVDCPPTEDRTELRRAYLRRLRNIHPDVNDRADAAARTAELTSAYEHLDDVLAGGPGTWRTTPNPTPDRGSGSAAPPTTPPTAPPVDRPSSPHTWEWRSPPPASPPEAWVLANDTLAVQAPPDETFDALVQVLCEIGDVTYLDATAAVIQTVVTFVDEPVCWMVTTLQGRAATGVTEVHCAIESIEERPPPPIGAVTALLASTFDV